MALEDDDIVTSKVHKRRSFLKRVGGVVAGSLAVVAGPSAASKRDARDFIPADSKVSDIDKRDPRADGDRRSGDQA